MEGGWNLDGKGLSVADIATYKPDVDTKNFAAHMHVTVNAVKEAIADPTDTIYPKRRGIDFIIVTKKIWRYLLRWVSKYYAYRLHGRDYFQQEKNWSQMSRALLLSKCLSRNAAFRNQTDRDTFSL